MKWIFFFGYDMKWILHIKTLINHVYEIFKEILIIISQSFKWFYNILYGYITWYTGESARDLTHGTLPKREGKKKSSQTSTNSPSQSNKKDWFVIDRVNIYLFEEKPSLPFTERPASMCWEW